MADKIYVRKGDTLESMEEQPFKTEDELQHLIATHLELLDGEQISPGVARRWILVTREKDIETPDGAYWWSLDHLLIDQDSIPTLVEVKRGDNSEVRRKVVGQMLDYAAHAEHWTPDELRRTFESTNPDSDADLGRLLGASEEDEEDWEQRKAKFWDEVGKNLAAKRLRLLFVADAIPDTLARVVAFLNEQMPRIEVLAVEIKQFKGATGQTLVPSVSGHTAVKPSEHGNRPPRAKITEDEFYSRLPSELARTAAKRLIDIAREGGAGIVWGGQGLSIRVDVPKEVWKNPITIAWFSPTPNVPYWAGLRDFSFGAAYPEYGSERLNGIMSRWAGFFPFGEEISFDGANGGGRTITHEQVVQHEDELATGLADMIAELRGISAP